VPLGYVTVSWAPINSKRVPLSWLSVTRASSDEIWPEPVSGVVSYVASDLVVDTDPILRLDW